MHSLTSALDGSEWSASCPSHFTPRVRAPGTCWIGGWVHVYVNFKWSYLTGCNKNTFLLNVQVQI